MAIDFPNSPTTNQIYTVGSRSWKWDGTIWAIYSNNPVLYRQDSPPSSPQEGDQWFETDTGRMFVYYGTAWVELGNATDVAGALQPSQVTALSAVTTLTSDDVFPVVDGPSGAVASSKITWGNVQSSITSTGTLGSLAVTGDITRGGVSLPRGIVARATSQTTYVLTTSPTAQATGMSVTFTAVANRYYKITYYEPQGQTPSVVGYSQTFLRQTSSTGTVLGNNVFTNETAAGTQDEMIIIKTATFASGSVTLVGTASTTSTSGGPQLIRDATREALLLVEDIGAA